MTPHPTIILYGISKTRLDLKDSAYNFWDLPSLG